MTPFLEGYYENEGSASASGADSGAVPDGCVINAIQSGHREVCGTASNPEQKRAEITCEISEFKVY